MKNTMLTAPPKSRYISTINTLRCFRSFFSLPLGKGWGWAFIASLSLLATSSSYAQKVYKVKYESQADLKVYVVDYESQCDLKVYHVDYSSQASKDGLWYSVEYESQADYKVYFVDYSSQANLKIYYMDYSSQAGWKNKSKAHLLKF